MRLISNVIQRLVDTTQVGAALSPTAFRGSSRRIEHSPAGNARPVLCLALVPRIPQALPLDMLAGALSEARHHVTGAALLVSPADATPLHNCGRRVFLDKVAQGDSR